MTTHDGRGTQEGLDITLSIPTKGVIGGRLEVGLGPKCLNEGRGCIALTAYVEDRRGVTASTSGYE